MISNFFQNIGTTIESTVVTPAQNIATALSGYLVPVVTGGLTLWVMVYGLAVVRGSVQMPVNDFVWRATKISVICFIGTSGGIYQADAFAFFNEISNLIYNAINIGAGANCPVSSHDQFGIYNALDCTSNEVLINTVFKIKDALWGLIAPPDAGLITVAENIVKNLLDIVLVDLMLGVTIICSVCLFALVGFEIAMVRITLAMIFALSPLFIYALAFEPTKQLFHNWLNKVFSSILLPALYMMYTGLALSMVGNFVATYLNVAKFIDPNLLMANLIYNLLFFVLLLVFLIFGALRIPQLASDLTGGHGGQSSFGLAAAMMVRMASKGMGGKNKNKGNEGGEISQ